MNLLNICAIVFLCSSTSIWAMEEERMVTEFYFMWNMLTKEKIQELQNISDQEIKKIEKKEDESRIEYQAGLTNNDYIVCTRYKKKNNFCCYRMPFIKTEESNYSSPITLPSSYFHKLKTLYEKQ